MKTTTEHDHDARCCVIRVQGDIDSFTAPVLESELEAALNRGCTNLVIDLARVAYADSSALRLIVLMNRALEPRHGRLVLAGASRDVERVLALSGLVGAAPTVSAAGSAEDAIAGLTLAAPIEPPLWTRALEEHACSASLATMRSDVCDLLEPLEMSEATRFDVRVAVGEALSNAVRHGSPGGEEDTVRVIVTAYPDRVALTVIDSGEGFDGEPEADGDPYAPSGRGVMFMRALMDQVVFERLSEGGTAVTLVRHTSDAVLRPSETAV